MIQNEGLPAAVSRTADTNGSTPPQPEIKLYVVKRLRRAFLSICRCGDSILNEHGVTMDQYFLIRAVQKNAGIRQGDLGSEVSADANTVAAMVALLEKRGILRREACPDDGRARRLHATAKGNRIMKKLMKEWEPIGNRLFDCFHDEAGLEALAILDRVHDEMTELRTEISGATASRRVVARKIQGRAAKRRAGPAR